MPMPLDPIAQMLADAIRHVAAKRDRLSAAFPLAVINLVAMTPEGPRLERVTCHGFIVPPPALTVRN